MYQGTSPAIEIDYDEELTNLTQRQLKSHVVNINGKDIESILDSVNIEMEVWLPIANSDYFISNLGRVKNKNGRISEESVLKGHGYIRSNININGVSTKPYTHRLVAQTFIPNPEKRSFVNHINGIKTDNQVDNLEWVTPKENANRKIFPNPASRGRSRKVVQKTLNEDIIQIWDSAKLAEWREIEFNSQKFQVSSLGRVKLLNGMITQGSLSAGYFRVGRKYLNYQVHRLVAVAFCLKEQGKNYVNHIDGNSTNNKASNLEWCTQKENMQHAVHLRLWNGYKRAVKQIFDNAFTQEFLSLKEAERATGIKSQNIMAVCQD
ncbi:10262_t:CDS:2 [Ambispora leptoticha]|uniref:10262_t:CDS:1 n=1 Tax=Ambispora leptoticha TaxID=144679 RepID=A0A9N9DL15_9GLOM|nr:10262_t:CDS:2 [Ambispora leptoticha]